MIQCIRDNVAFVSSVLKPTDAEELVPPVQVPMKGFPMKGVLKPTQKHTMGSSEPSSSSKVRKVLEQLLEPCFKTGVSISVELLSLLVWVLQQILSLTPLEACALTFLADGFATIGCNVFSTMMWQNLLTMLVLLLASLDWHVPQYLPFYSLICRTLSCTCCYVLRSTYPMVVAVAFVVPTFGKQGRLPFAPSSAAKPAKQGRLPFTPSSAAKPALAASSNEPASSTASFPKDSSADAKSDLSERPQSSITKSTPREHIRSRSPTIYAGPCPGCARCGQTTERNSTECRQLQSLIGCHACDKKGCWAGGPRCRFAGRSREADADADFGDNVPHIAGERNIQIVCDKIPLKNGQRMPPLWFAGHSVLVRIDDKAFTMGEASGDGYNCLISTLMQSLGVICNVSYIRSELERRHKGKTSRIQPGTYLELKEHWRDIVDLLGVHNLVNKKFSADHFRIVCIDVNLPGHGDVLPAGNDDGRINVYIARQNLNHFVPLIRLWGTEEAGYMHGPEQSSGAAKPASSSGAAKPASSTGAAETASSTSGGKNTASDASNAVATERKATQSIPGDAPTSTSSQSNSGEKPAVPVLDGTDKPSWAQMLLMLQDIENKPMAKKLLNDVPILRQWQETDRVSGNESWSLGHGANRRPLW